MMNLVNVRLLNQQLVSPLYEKAEDVVRFFGAMQAQDYRMMRWAVAMRTKRPSEEAFKKAFDDGRIVRLHLMRGTWQLINSDDYWWMIDLFASKARRIILGWMKNNKIEISENELRSVREILVDAVDNDCCVTMDGFEKSLLKNNMAMDRHRLSYHIRLAEIDGVLCSGDLLPMKATYALARKKMKQCEKMDRDDALMLLAKKYFQSHQPATLEDFVWWSGLGVADCKKAISLLGAAVHVERCAGQEFYLTGDCRKRGARSGVCHLIPSYDEYLIGYKSRDVVLDARYRSYAHNDFGIFRPVVAYNGRICGNWSPYGKNLDVNIFADGCEDADFSVAEERYKRYIWK